jgi:hypothetical protein
VHFEDLPRIEWRSLVVAGHLLEDLLKIDVSALEVSREVGVGLLGLRGVLC